MTKTLPVSVRLETGLSDQVASLAKALDRPKSWVIEQAVRDYVTAGTGLASRDRSEHRKMTDARRAQFILVRTQRSNHIRR